METLAQQPLPTQNSGEDHSNIEVQDRTILLGYILLIISAGLYGLEEYYDVARNDDNLTAFFIHYFLSIAFVIALIVDNAYGVRKSWRREHIHKTVICLHLFLVSAYALNRQLPIFEESVPWFSVYLILASLVMLSYQYFNSLPKAVNYIQHLLLGSSLLLYLYLAIYVANFYIVGSIGIILFGIGAHIFVPLLLLFAAIRLLRITQEKKRISIGWVVSGAVITIGLAVSFVIEWNARVQAIDRMANQSVIHADIELPVWVKVGQVLKNDWITERILKSRLVYTTAHNHFQWDFSPIDNNWDEKRKHDPLVFIASGSSNSTLSDEDRKNILKAITDSRHKAQERLWSGDNLSTSYIVSDIDLYPELRIAYTEHYLNIRNNSTTNNRWSGNSEEAVYTFQLTEGSVVTSLSLWMNGKEEKAILTSKQKAAEAYTTIVGREMRDPSVVQWQEGNTVSVRVFPCTPQEERKFKLGITSPLAILKDKMVYNNLTFRGPNASAATQTIRMRFMGKLTNTELPDKFQKNLKGEFVSEGAYEESLAIAMDVTPIKQNQFSFDGFTYALSELRPAMVNVDLNEVYLDLNNSWTPREIEALRPLLSEYKVYAYMENDFVHISPDNWTPITDALTERNFSLFPFHHIKQPSKAIVVTKGKELSPYLRDVQESVFAEGLSAYFASGKKVYVFNLEGSISTYIKSLKELRAFHFAQGNSETLLANLKSKTFPLAAESDESVALHESNLMIQRKLGKNTTAENNAPDHLARLFAYNNIMRQIGNHYFKEDFINEKLIEEAATAYVVSPVSSLIVLEAKEDYERFGIKDKENSLHNATKNSSGAVPEPHEWVLIIVFLFFIAFYVVRSRLKSSFLKI